MHLHRGQRSRQDGPPDRGGGFCADLGQTPRRVSLGTWRRARAAAAARRLRGATLAAGSRHKRAEPMTHEPGLVPRPGILDISPYVGGEAKLPGVERPIRLASNESALGPSSKAIAAYRALAGEIHRYPDGNAQELREPLGHSHGLDPERIFCRPASDQLIPL